MSPSSVPPSPDGSDPASCVIEDTVDPETDQKCTVVFEDPLGTITIEKREDDGVAGANGSLLPRPFPNP